MIYSGKQYGFVVEPAASGLLLSRLIMYRMTLYRLHLTYLKKFPVYLPLICAVLAAFCPVQVSAQIGLKYLLSNKKVVEFAKSDIPPYGLGLGFSGSIPLSERTMRVVRKTELDFAAHAYVITENYFGNQSRIPLVIDMDEMLPLSHRMQLERLWFESSTGAINTYRPVESRSRGFNISIPVPIQSEAFNRIIGGSGTLASLEVDGEVNIDGKLVHQDRSQVKDVYRGSDYSFRMEQTQKFNISGKVGDKISVDVDQNSQADFDLENSLRLTYRGNPDEVFQSVEAGNVSLSLPGTQFLTFSGVNKGLFGFKAVNKLGPLDITTIASLERGQKQSLKLKGGAKSQKTIIKDYDYVRGLYFFIDTKYRDSYVYDENGVPTYNPNNVVAEFELWKSGRDYNTNLEAKVAWAVWDPKNIVHEDTLSGGDQNHVKRHFVRLIPNQDYFLSKDLGYVVLDMPVRNEILALAYITVSGDTVGNLIPPDELFPPEDRPFILKLLHTENPQPSDAAWTMEWKNVYSLGSRSISPTGFELQIVNNTTTERDLVQDDGKSFLEIFGLDRRGVSGEMGSDEIVDVGNSYIFNFGSGYMIMPGIRPFDPDKDPFTHEEPLLDATLRTPEIYDVLYRTRGDYNNISKFDIEITSSAVSQTFTLGWNILEGSEEVFLEGRRLLKGVDYTIDYLSGSLIILNEDALRQGAELEVRYESGEFMQLQKKTLFGTSLTYSLGGDNAIRGSALFLNERIIDTRVPVGSEPKQNIAWDVNTNLSYQSDMLTRMIDKLPFVNAERPSSISFEGEFAQSLPNPNTLNNEATGDYKGVADLDNFEGIQRKTALQIGRRFWTASSLPKEDPETGEKKSIDQWMTDRAKMIWHNPFTQVHIKEIFPNKEISERTQDRVNVLNIGFIEDSRGRFPDNPWGGIMQWLKQYDFNQSESKYLEMWVNGDNGLIHIDLGLISEDAVPNNKLDTEDGIFSGYLNKILEDEEDVGIWHNWNLENPDQQWDDEWGYVPGSPDYSMINGTKGNGTGTKVDGTRIPDTEDLDSDGGIDLRNEYFQFTIDLSNDAVSGDYKVSGPNEHGWKFYRIPLNDFISIGNPDWSQIEYARIWFEDLPKDNIIKIYSADLVGNRWKELGIAESDSLVKLVKYTINDSIVFISAVNTEDNLDVYTSPPGVQGQYDRITLVHAREQALQLGFKDLQSGQSAAGRSVFTGDKDIIQYRRLKMFVYGDPALTSGDSSRVEFFLQFGLNDKNYYEIRKPLYPQWDARNEINVDLWELPEIKSEIYGNSRVFENGERWTAVGNPTLRKIRIVTVGIKNASASTIEEGFVWIDELRVSEVNRASGTAFRGGASMRISDLANISASFSRRDDEFRILNQKFGTLNNTNEYSLSLRGFNIERLFTPLRAFNIPLNYSINRSNSIPKYLQGSDVLYQPDLPGAEEQKQHSQRTSFDTSIRKLPSSKNWFIKNSIEAVTTSFSRQFTSSRDITRQVNRSTVSTGRLIYSLNLGSHYIEPFKFFTNTWLLQKISQMKFYYTPPNLTANFRATEKSQIQKLRKKETSSESYSLNASRSFSTSYTPIDNLTMSLTRSSDHDLSNVKNKWEIFPEMFNDSTAISNRQEFSGRFNPRILSWISPSVTYNSTYQLARSRQLKQTGKTASLTRSFRTEFSLTPTNLMSKIYKPPAAKQPQTPQPQRSDTTQVMLPDSIQQESRTYELNPLWYLNKLVERLQPVRFDFEQRSSLNIPSLDGTPGMGFQFGFSQDPGVPVLEQFGRNVKREMGNTSLGISSSVRVNKNVSVSFSFNKASTETNQGNNRTGNKSISMLIYKDTKIPMLEYLVQVVNLHEAPYVSKVADNVSFSHRYSGKKNLEWKDSPDNLTKTKFDWGFSPLAQFRITWKKGISSVITMDRSNSFFIDNRIGVERKENRNSIRANASYRLESGFNIPFPFGLFKDTSIKNSVTFSINFEKTSNVTLEKLPKQDEFNVRDKRSSMVLGSTVSYSFTSRVDGGFNFRWQVTDNNRIGKNTNKDFSLNVRIKITG